MMLGFMSMTVGEEHVFEATIRRKGHRRDAQTWKSTLEAIESREGARVAPLFAVEARLSVSGHSSSTFKARVRTLAPMDR
jgi:hypothetical protein